ncbi:alpha/beta hydrolase [Georgenia halophila]|uniref:alpha/beta fold hydrolase n=1 Tax=Georgenia halophila TaxID=620889 RepID=UPI0031EA4434
MPTLQLSGGPGCVHYLPDAPADAPVRLFAPEPRGVGASEGGTHDIARALADLEEIRRANGIEDWAVVGHSFGADLALAYAVERPRSIRGVIGACGTGVQHDRDWSAAYHARKDDDPSRVDIEYSPEVHRSLLTSWRSWIKEPSLLRRLSRLTVPVSFLVAGQDIRPSWPVEQLAQLIPGATLTALPDVPHDFWHSHPEVWTEQVSLASQF